MTQRILGLLFDAGGKNNILAVLDLGELLTEADLERTVAKRAPYALPALRVDPQQGELTVFGYPLQLESTGLACEAGILAVDSALDPLGTGELLAPAKGTFLSRLHLEGDLSVKGKAAGTTGALQLSAEGTAAAGLTYEHVRPVSGSESIGRAFAGLVRSTQLPHFARLERLEKGEALVFDGFVRLDFGAKVRAGASVDIEDVVRPFGRLELPVQAHVRFMAEAAVGWSLYERMRLAVVRGLTIEDDWVRVRLDRESKRTFTLGALFELGVKYDAAKGVEAILDEAFDLVPKGRAIDLVRQIAGTPWGELRDGIADEAAETLSAFVDKTGWKEWLAKSDDVKKLTAAAKTFVTAWDDLDDRVREIWSGLLGRVDIGKDSSFRQHLDAIADLDPATLDAASYLPGQLGKAWNLLETLLGEDLEDLLLAGRLGTALEEAIERAKKLRKFLDKAPETVIEGIERVAERTGIKALATFLRDTATSVNDLESSMSALVAKLVRRLVGKVIGKITEADVAVIRETAKELTAVLDKAGALETRLRKEVGRLRGEWKGSLTLGFSSETKAEGLLDLEVDPGDKAARRAVEENLRSGDIAQLLLALDEAGDGFRIRACRLTSSRIRRTATTLLLSWLPSAVEVARIEETSIAVDEKKERTYSFSGGAQRKVTEGAESIARMTVTVEAKGTGLDLDAPCSRGDARLDFGFTREDDKTTKDELLALGDLLATLGFAPPPVDLAATVQQTGISTSIFVGLRFGEKAITTAFGGLGTAVADALWDDHFRQAAAVWFRDGLVPREDVKLGPVGEMLAKVVESQEFDAIWNDGRWPTKTVWFPVDDKSVSSKAAVLIPARTIVNSSSNAWAAARALKLPDKTTSPAELREFMKQASRTMKAATAADWQSPLFALWLVRTRLGAKLWNKATGVATLRWRASAGDEWSQPVMWKK